MTARDRPLRAALLVGLVALLVYVPSLDGGFVYDDWMLLVQNENVHDLSRPWRFFTNPGTLSEHGALHSYRPIRTLMFAVEWQVFGERAAGYRIVSAVLHALVALMLLALLRRFTARPRGSLLAALLFAVHPVTTECVPWISIQGDLVSAGALLAALWCLDEPRPARIALGVGLFLLSSGAKESGVVLPALLLVRVFWLPREEGDRRRWLAAAAVVIVAALAYTVLRQVMVTGVAGQTAAHRDWYGDTWLASVGAFFSGIVFYAGTLLLPVELTIRWSPTAPPDGPLQVAILAIGIAVVLAILVGGISLRRRHPVTSAGLLMALLVLGPASSILLPLPTITEIRYLYPVLAFLALALAPALHRVRGVAPWLLLALLAVLTIRRAEEWNSNDSLWTAAANRPRSTPEALFNVGHARFTMAKDRFRAGRHSDELLHLIASRRAFIAYANERRASLAQMDPAEIERLVGCLDEIAARLLDFGRPQDAIDPLLAALDFGGPTPERLRRLARSLEEAGHREEAARARRDADRLESGGSRDR